MRVAFLRKALLYTMRVLRRREPNSPAGSSSSGAGRRYSPARQIGPLPSLIPVLVVGVYAVHSTKPLVVGTPPSSCAGGGGLSVLPISYPYQIALRLAPRQASFEQDGCCTHGEELSFSLISYPRWYTSLRDPGGFRYGEGAFC